MAAPAFITAKNRVFGTAQLQAAWRGSGHKARFLFLQYSGEPIELEYDNPNEAQLALAAFITALTDYQDVAVPTPSITSITPSTAVFQGYDGTEHYTEVTLAGAGFQSGGLWGLGWGIDPAVAAKIYTITSISSTQIVGHLVHENADGLTHNTDMGYPVIYIGPDAQTCFIMDSGAVKQDAFTLTST